ncbi:MAG: histidine--tRNA ligase [Patescibacteria group bacterium]
MKPAPKGDKPKKETPKLQAPRGMHDVLPSEQPYWEKITGATGDVARFYGFQKIDTPVIEYASLFIKTTGEDTDVVTKEMYTLKTRGGDVLALRPEFTPSIARAYLEHGLSRLGQPQRLYHFGPTFRHEKPQLGRLRQFTQLGFEILGGTNDFIYDAQVILMFTNLLGELRIKNTSLKINSIGCRVCRPLYKKQLQSFYKNHEKDLCLNCVKRLKSNPLRLLDCKNPECEKIKTKAPNILNKLCLTCGTHFKGVLECLDELQIPYTLDSHLVRGLDYYSRTVFEIFADNDVSGIGALPAGGRYDYLMESLGGHLTPAVGGACSVERLIAAMKLNNVEVSPKTVKRVFLAHAGDSAKKKALKLIRDLYGAGIPIAESLSKESLKAQLKSADKSGAAIALIMGQKEIYESNIIMRDLRTGLQETVSLDKIVGEIKKKFKENKQ